MPNTLITNQLSKFTLFLERLIESRLKHHFEESQTLFQLPVLRTNGVQTPLNQFIHANRLNTEEISVLLFALIPHLQPHFLDEVVRHHIPKAGDFPQIGGIRGKNFRGFLPTGETALFLLAGDDLDKRLAIQQLFSPDHFFAKKRLLWLQSPLPGEPLMSGQLIMSQEYIDLFTTGKISRPRFSTTFPAQLVETEMEWNDLILKQETIQQIKELETFIKHGTTLMQDWGMRKKLKPGYRVLFHGPPGTGKTLTASLLGKYTNKEVYKIDLSMIVSKFIGETEKNLANLFAKAENKDWILFFDEADALFGKRTNVKDAHDKYANQEVSYLLQRVETYNGLVILATNFKSNMDEAFIRRFQSIISFQLPNSTERLQLWRGGLPKKVKLARDIDLNKIATKYEITGAGIMNIIQYACFRALERGDQTIYQKDLLNGIRKEFLKEGKMMR